MALKIRLARFGSIHNPVYRVVVAEARSRRDGAAVEQLGTYNPKISNTPIKLNIDRADYWVSKGARPTDTVRSLIKRARASAPAPAPAVEVEDAAPVEPAEETAAPEVSETPAE